MGKQESIISRINSLINESTLSMSAFAQKAGLDPSNFAKKMRGALPITKKDAVRISNGFGISAEWLLGGEGKQPALRPADNGVNEAKGMAASRLMEYLNKKGIAPFRAEMLCGYSNGSIGKAARNGAAIGSDKLEKILGVYTDLSAEWLLRGVGPMIKGSSKMTELEVRLNQMTSNMKNKEEAYSLLLSMLDMMGKTYHFFSEKEGE